MFERLLIGFHRWRLRRRMRRFGWTGVYVGDYSTSPTWAYTLGFQASLGAPEIVVFDLPKRVANSLFHEVYRQLKARELVIRDGEPWGDADGPRAAWRRVQVGTKMLNSRGWASPRRSMSA